MQPTAYLGPECPRGPPQKAPKNPKMAIWPNFGDKNPRCVVSFQILSFRFHWIEHPQKPCCIPRAHFLTTRVPLFVTFLVFKIQSGFAPKGLCRFQPFRDPAPGKKSFKFFFQVQVTSGQGWPFVFFNSKKHVFFIKKTPLGGSHFFLDF